MAIKNEKEKTYMLKNDCLMVSEIVLRTQWC